MKKKIAKTIIGIIILIIAIIMLIISFFLIMDIESKAPEEVQIDCNLETEEFIGRKVFIITPKNEQKSQKVILYLHGGSYVAETSSNHWKFLEKLVKDTNATIILPDYPLTPKYTYKDVFTMITPLYKEIIEEVPTNNLILMGDSAGGGMGLALLERLSEENIEMPYKTILMSPWLDVRLENPEIDNVQKYDKDLNKESLKIAGIAYAGKDGIDSYLVNPIDGDLSKLKNITIFTGTYDILNPDVHVLEEKANEVNVDLEIKEYEGAGHIWFINNNSSKELEEAGYQDLLEEVKGLE